MAAIGISLGKLVFSWAPEKERLSLCYVGSWPLGIENPSAINMFWQVITRGTEECAPYWNRQRNTPYTIWNP
jgi:hypothetical protein